VGNALAAGDLVDLINAIVDFPARIIDGVLNGGYPLPLGGTDNGLLTPAGAPPGPLAIPINFLAAIIGAAGIEFPFRPAPVDQPPSLQAATVTLSTGPSVDSGSADPGFAKATVVKPGEDVDGLANTTAEPPGHVAGGFIKTTTEPPAQQDKEVDPPTAERPAGGTDLTHGNKVQPGQPPSTDPTARKTPLRDTFDKAGSDINKVVTDLSSNVKKAQGGVKNDADNGDDANNGDNGKDGTK
ncbi:MAG TPA: hypothetical protein VMS92_00735, partial [Mycobacterium sp.]|nr:hypothetical protein [Mycobacterium sp.]